MNILLWWDAILEQEHYADMAVITNLFQTKDVTTMCGDRKLQACYDTVISVLERNFSKTIKDGGSDESEFSLDKFASENISKYSFLISKKLIAEELDKEFKELIIYNAKDSYNLYSNSNYKIDYSKPTWEEDRENFSKYVSLKRVLAMQVLDRVFKDNPKYLCPRGYSTACRNNYLNEVHYQMRYDTNSRNISFKEIISKLQRFEETGSAVEYVKSLLK